MVNHTEEATSTWITETSKKVNAAKGTDYVELDQGLMTVDQIDAMLNCLPLEFVTVDKDDRYIYCNNEIPKNLLLSPRWPERLGQTLTEIHKDTSMPSVQKIMDYAKTGKTYRLIMASEKQYMVASFKNMQDKNNEYAGVTEWIIDLLPVIKRYLKQTGQKLVPDENNQTADVVSGASKK
ncbi:PAS domain-containing protein [Lactobacillus sp. ESL0731]|uniref:PAS domain-containing protein n=1 Tax=unclassified Lactobacillus TaxID=2620435 RepID=UPI0023F7637B|nr:MULTISPECIES: PAS domain-containing protein [unclassified Lactobacillus]WEV50801.1 PAS domain-containing protein [Lactobacillus sp. ESL0700]WEV61932.1 PAS domain-containing protein [Lactobacillus sp. ESL0731]